MRSQLQTLDYTEEALPIPLERALIRAEAATAPAAAFLADALRRIAPQRRPRRGLGALLLSVIAIACVSLAAGYSMAHFVAPYVEMQLSP